MYAKGLGGGGPDLRAAKPRQSLDVCEASDVWVVALLRAMAGVGGKLRR